MNKLSQARVLEPTRSMVQPASCKNVEQDFSIQGVMEMAVLLQEYSTQVVASDGTIYDVRSYGEERLDGTWTGWLQFHPADITKPVLSTDQETSQPNRMSLEYWATGLEPVYFEGAFERAVDNSIP